MKLWSLEFWRLAWLAGVLTLAGLVFDAPGLGLALGVGVYLVFHLRQLHALHHWLTHARHGDPPEASGIWGEIFDRLHHHQKAQAKTQQRRSKPPTSTADIRLSYQIIILWEVENKLAFKHQRKRSIS